MNLLERRTASERGLTCQEFHIGTLQGREIDALAVLTDADGRYHVHRYFEIAGAWEVSYDAKRTTADGALECVFDYMRLAIL